MRKPDDAQSPGRQESIITLLHLHLGQMPPAVQKAAILLIQEGFHLQDFSITELAKQAQVSTAAIVRMCQILGFKGFRDFRLRWVREAGSRAVDGKNGALMPTSVDRIVAQSRELHDPVALEQAAAMIVAAQRLFVYGGGSSSLIATMVARMFAHYGHLALAFNAHDLDDTAPGLTDAKTVIMIISHRGYNPQIERRVQIDKQRGAHVILVTSNPHSNLASLADIVLLTGGQGLQAEDYVDLPARVAQIIGVQSLLELVIQKQTTTAT